MSELNFTSVLGYIYNFDIKIRKCFLHRNIFERTTFCGLGWNSIDLKVNPLSKRFKGNL